MYGHVITKFSGMGRFTYPWCSASARFARGSSAIICQRKKKKENLVEKPEAHEKVWVSIEEWSKYGNLQYTEVWKKLRFTSVQELEDGRASWHRSCFKDAVHVQ